MSKPFYLTTTLPYVNAEAHLGHALEFIRADALARVKKKLGFEVFFNTGTDEHGRKIEEAALTAGQEPQAYTDALAAKFQALYPLLGISEDIHFIRTTDSKHKAAAQEFWRRVDANGHIYKKKYSAKYCVGCEAEKTDSELVDGRCPLHPNREIELIDEENYFFRFSAFGDHLLSLYEAARKEGRSFVVPEFRLREMEEFISRGLQDFSISRLSRKMPWGIPVPGDSEQVMYVWFDALTNYISTLGWPEDRETFEKFWRDGTPTQYCGKDNTRFQSVMWQAMLLAADLPPSYAIVVNGFVTGEGGVKMSKSLGNVIDPLEFVREYGTDALRYFVLREVSPFEDSPVTPERFKETYNANLANGLGNLSSRILRMAVSYEVDLSPVSFAPDMDAFKISETFDHKAALDLVWKKISLLDQAIEEKRPFELAKTNRVAAQEIVLDLGKSLAAIAATLEPYLPETARILTELIKNNRMPEKPLFPRKD